MSNSLPISNRKSIAPYGLMIGLVALVILFSVLIPDQFATLANLRTTISSQSVLAILALAVLVPLIAGEFDVSLAMVFTTTMLIVAKLVTDFGWSLPSAAASGLVAATLLGCTTGALVILTRASSLIVSLGMMILLRGASEALTEGRSITVAGENGAVLRGLSTELAFGALPFVYLCGIAVLVWYVTEMTPLGRKWHAVGGISREAEPKTKRLNTLVARAGNAGRFILDGGDHTAFRIAGDLVRIHANLELGVRGLAANAVLRFSILRVRFAAPGGFNTGGNQ